MRVLWFEPLFAFLIARDKEDFLKHFRRNHQLKRLKYIRFVGLVGFVLIRKNNYRFYGNTTHLGGASVIRKTCYFENTVLL